MHVYLQAQYQWDMKSPNITNQLPAFHTMFIQRTYENFMQFHVPFLDKYIPNKTREVENEFFFKKMF